MARRKVAIILSGGGSLGAYIAGALDELLLAFAASPDFEVDIITGASAGGITGALVTYGLLYRGGAHALQEVWLDKMDMVEMLAPEVPDEPFALLNIHPLLRVSQNLIRQPFATPPTRAAYCATQLTLGLTMSNETLVPYILPVAQAAAGRIEPYVVARSTEQESFYFTSEIPPTDPIWDRAATVVQATAAIPFVFPPVRLTRSTDPRYGDQQYIEKPNFAGEADFWYVDGGLFNNMPLDLAWYHANKTPLDLADRVLLVVNPWRPNTAPPPIAPEEKSPLGRLFNFLSLIYTESSALPLQHTVRPTNDTGERALTPGVNSPPEEILNQVALVMPLPDQPLRGAGLGSLVGFLDRRFRDYDWRRGAADGQRVAREVLQIAYPAPHPSDYYDPDHDPQLAADLSSYAALDTIPSTRDPRRSVREVFETALEGRIKALVARWDVPGLDVLVDAPLTALIKHEVLRQIAAAWRR